MEALRVIEAELRREFKLLQAYRVAYLGQQVVYVLGFLMMVGLFQIITDGQYTAQARLVSMVGFLTWTVADGCLGRIALGLQDDAQWGTYEQVWLSGASPQLILFARSLAILLRYAVLAVISAAILIPVLGASLPSIWYSLSLVFLFPLSLAGVFGMAFIVAGLHLVYKRVAFVQLALSTALFFLTGVLAPLDYSSRLYSWIARFLPLTTGIKLMRDMLQPDSSLAGLFTRPEFYWLLVVSGAYGLAGWLVFYWAHHVARRQGSLGHY